MASRRIVQIQGIGGEVETAVLRVLGAGRGRQGLVPRFTKNAPAAS
ncbi:hypothetical protein ACIHFB_17465 [Streptomyces sp. NPDC051963]